MPESFAHASPRPPHPLPTNISKVRVCIRQRTLRCSRGRDHGRDRSSFRDGQSSRRSRAPPARVGDPRPGARRDVAVRTGSVAPHPPTRADAEGRVPDGGHSRELGAATARSVPRIRARGSSLHSVCCCSLRARRFCSRAPGDHALRRPPVADGGSRDPRDERLRRLARQQDLGHPRHLGGANPLRPDRGRATILGDRARSRRGVAEEARTTRGHRRGRRSPGRTRPSAMHRDARDPGTSTSGLRPRRESARTSYRRSAGASRASRSDDATRGRDRRQALPDRSLLPGSQDRDRVRQLAVPLRTPVVRRRPSSARTNSWCSGSWSCTSRQSPRTW